jgi:hypothetical protein
MLRRHCGQLLRPAPEVSHWSTQLIWNLRRQQSIMMSSDMSASKHIPHSSGSSAGGSTWVVDATASPTSSDGMQLCSSGGTCELGASSSVCSTKHITRRNCKAGWLGGWLVTWRHLSPCWSDWFSATETRTAPVVKRVAFSPKRIQMALENCGKG